MNIFSHSLFSQNILNWGFISSRLLYGILLLLVIGLSNLNYAAETSATSSSSAEQEQPTKELNLDLGLAELIDSNKLGESWVGSIYATFEKSHLLNSVYGKSLANLLMVLIFLLLYFFVKKIIYKLVNRLNSLENINNIPYQRIKRYLSLLNLSVILLFMCIFVMVTSGIWHKKPEDSFYYNPASSIFQFVATFTFLMVLGIVIFEIISTLLERFFSRWGDTNSTRIQTLLPIVRTSINSALFIILGITLISELGINVLPLLAGAGVIGIAIGFGAQAIFKDLFTGFTIIMEDLLQIGDVVTLGGKTGQVELITIRKVQLRTFDGVVCTIPFSEISIVENLTKDYSYYVFNVGVAYKESPDEVIELLKEVGESMEADEKFSKLILSPLEIFGVDSFAESAVMIKARFKTLPLRQWDVGREFNRRMKYSFDKAGVEIPFPQQTVYFRKERQTSLPKKV